MKKQKYTLSKEGQERLMKALKQMAQDTIEDSNGLHNTPITTNFIKAMTKVKDLDDVIQRNEQLSKTYQGFLSLYGFETLYDMYIYAKSCEGYPEEITKSKDTVVMPVTKTIMRNGSLMEVTVWEQIEKREKEIKEPTTIRHARELVGTLLPSDELTNPYKVALLKSETSHLDHGDKPFSDQSKYYFTLKDTEGHIAAIVGFIEQGNAYSMDFYRTNGKVSGVASRGFFEMIKLALKNGKGVVASDHPQARSVYSKAGLQKKGDHWVISYEDLKRIYGESRNTCEHHDL